MFRRFSLLLAATGLVLGLLVAPQTVLAHDGAEVRSGPCPPVLLQGLQMVGGPLVVAECGSLAAPLRHAQPDGREVQTIFVRFISLNPRKSPEPLFMVQGGPGGSALMVFTSFLYPGGEPGPIIADRDVVVIEQRGTSDQLPSLKCPQVSEANRQDLDTGAPPAAEVARARGVAATQACRQALEAQGIDLTAFNTTENAADINAVRVGLGYSKVHLYGVSYGTFLAQNVLRNHPQGLASVVLDAVVPVGRTFANEAGVAFNSALNQVFRDCRASADCAARNGDIERLLFETVDRLDRVPAQVEIALPGPDGPVLDRAPVNGDGLLSMVFAALYSDIYAQQMPALIAAAARGDLSGLAPFAAGSYTEPYALGMYLSVTCSEFPARLASFPRGDYRTRLELWASRAVASGEAQCAVWARDPANARSGAPVSRGSVPVLVVSGAFDPITPPSYGREVAGYLNAPHLVLPNGAHGGLGTTCGAEAIADFLESPGPLPRTPCLATLAPVFTAPAQVNDPVPTTGR